MRQGRLIKDSRLTITDGAGASSTSNAPIEVPCGGAWLFVWVGEPAVSSATSTVSVVPQQAAQTFRRDSSWDGWSQGIWLSSDTYNLVYTPGPTPPGAASNLRWALFANPEDCHE